MGSTIQRLELTSWAMGTGLASGEVGQREIAQNDDAHSRIVDSMIFMHILKWIVTFVLVFSIAWTSSNPPTALPEIVCFLSSHGVAVVIKSCVPLARARVGHAHSSWTVMTRIISGLVLKFFTPNVSPPEGGLRSGS